MIVKTGGFMTFPTDPEDFVEVVSEGGLTSEQFLSLIEQHDHNWNDCEICEYIWDDLDEGTISEILIKQNPQAVTAIVLDRSLTHLKENFEWNNGGYEESVAVELTQSLQRNRLNLVPLSSSGAKASKFATTVNHMTKKTS
jgi:hypothetical protein